MRLPLSTTLKNRGSTTAKDARLVNAFTEVKGGRERVVKRPSLVATFAALEAGAGNGQGLFSFSTPDGTQTIVGIQNDVLNNSPTPIATRLAFTTQPVDWKIATAMSPSIVITARNSFGGTMTSFTGDVTLSFQENPNGGTLSGTLSVAAIAGVATFSNLKIDKVGGGYKLLATGTQIFGAGRARVSSVFKIVSNLSFTVQPTSTLVNTQFVTQVTIVDSASGAITGYTGNITVALAVNAISTTLSGTLTVAAVNGVANFTDLSIDLPGTYLLQATADSGGMATAYSNSFEIDTSYQLTVSASTSDYNVYNAFVAKYGAAPPASVALSVTINSGVVVSSTSTSNGAITWDTSWTGTPVFTFVNNGHIVGKGGAGSQGGFQVPSGLGAGATGLTGGKAMELSGKTVSITNASGFIWGGGGGGGGGGAAACGAGANTASPGGGGGGGGAGSGGAGAAGATNAPTGDGTSNSPTAGTAASGSLATQTGANGGVGATGGTVIAGSTATGGNGGAGGDYGTAGSTGSSASFTGLGITFGSGGGGPAGKAINLTGGTANFVSGSGSPNVKGAVS